MTWADWRRDARLRKVAKQGLPVAFGKFAASVAGLVSLGILTRHLGPEGFGVIALARSIATLVDQYANCNTWQAIIKYGTESIANGRRDQLAPLIKLSVVLELITGSIGAIVVVGITTLIPATFGWSQHDGALCALYGLTLVAKVAGTADGIFRVCDAYRVQAIVSGVSAFLTTGLVAAAVLLGASLGGCIAALVIGEIVGNVALAAAAFWLARGAGFTGWLRCTLRGTRATFPGIMRFLISTNAQLTVKVTQVELDMVFVGALLGSAAAGAYRVMKQVGTIPGRVFMPFEQVLFTELARAAAQRDYVSFRRLLRRIVLLTGSASLVLWAIVAVFASHVIVAVAGSSFAAAADPLRWYLLGSAISIAAVPVMRGMIALGRPGTLLGFELATLVVLIVAVIEGGTRWGLLGVAAATVLQKTVQLIWSTAYVFRYTNRLIAVEARAQRTPSE